MSQQSELFINGRFFYSAPSSRHDAAFWEYALVQDGVIQTIGLKSDEDFEEARTNASVTHDLGGRYVLPGFIDGHVHFLLLGQSLQKVDLFGSKSLAEIRERIKAYAVAHPDAPRILGKGWMHSMLDGQALASMLDDLDPRPMFLDSKDLHATWCNTAGLEELGVPSMGEVKGGTIVRNETGKPSGLLEEAVIISKVWPHLAQVAPMEEKVTSLLAATKAYTAAGYTGCVDMAMDENSWEALLEIRRRDPSQLPLRISAYWIIMPKEDEKDNLAQVERAIALSQQYNREISPDLSVVGIKLICDGIVDACTAHLLEPYSTEAPSPEPIWSPKMITPVVKRADEAGLQCALHAIGDATVRIAIDAIEKIALQVSDIVSSILSSQRQKMPHA